jgi:hypothetical protein
MPAASYPLWLPLSIIGSAGVVLLLPGWLIVLVGIVTLYRRPRPEALASGCVSGISTLLLLNTDRLSAFLTVAPDARKSAGEQIIGAGAFLLACLIAYAFARLKFITPVSRFFRVDGRR